MTLNKRVPVHVLTGLFFFLYGVAVKARTAIGSCFRPRAYVLAIKVRNETGETWERCPSTPLEIFMVANYSDTTHGD